MTSAALASNLDCVADTQDFSQGGCNGRLRGIVLSKQPVAKGHRLLKILITNFKTACAQA